MSAAAALPASRHSRRQTPAKGAEQTIGLSQLLLSEAGGMFACVNN